MHTINATRLKFQPKGNQFLRLNLNPCGPKIKKWEKEPEDRNQVSIFKRVNSDINLSDNLNYLLNYKSDVKSDGHKKSKSAKVKKVRRHSFQISNFSNKQSNDYNVNCSSFQIKPTDVLIAASIFLYTQKFTEVRKQTGLFQTKGYIRSLNKHCNIQYSGKRHFSTFSNKQYSSTSNKWEEKNPDRKQFDNDNPNKNTSSTSKLNLNTNSLKFYAVGCGFSKDEDPRNFISESKYCITSESNSRNFGEDAAFIYKGQDMDVLGVSDGVGGWRNHGVDPSKFSGGLMRICKELLEEGKFKANQPIQLLTKAYNDLFKIPNLIGSATACIATFDRTNNMLYTANLGDSGFLVFRNGKIVHKSNAQVHSFNAPFQLSIVPASHRGSINDPPKKADYSNFQCEEGDIILLASDGLFDNVYEEHMMKLLELLNIVPNELFKLSNLEDSGTESDSENLEQSNIHGLHHKILPVLGKAVSSMVTITRSQAHNEKLLSPFAQEARRYGYRDTLGGKVDDITIIISIVGK